MKIKKILSYILIFTLIFTFNSALLAEELEPEEAQPSQEFLDWQEEQEAINQGLIASEDIEQRGYIPDPVDLSHLNDNPPILNFNKPQSKLINVRDAANYTIYKSNPNLTDVKNQGGYGTCWAHAAIGALEANARKNSLGNLDLSEFHMAYFVYGDSRAGKSFTRNTLK
ncbi:MAG: hypothetical protein IJP56_08535, partial [Synergistaceae bacterium]|nr:hypothetical protein [Synergistaceae bacterium]